MRIIHADFRGALVHHRNKTFNIATERYCSNIRGIVAGLQEHSVDKPIKGNCVSRKKPHRSALDV